METSTVNPELRTAIKLRHLADALSDNWEQLSTIGSRVKRSLAEASAYMKANGDEANQKQYEAIEKIMAGEISGLENMLTQAGEKLKSNSIDASLNWSAVQTHLDRVAQQFEKLQALPATGFTKGTAVDWKDIWNVVGSNLDAVRGICTSAYLKARMLADLSTIEMDELSATIVKHIPKSYSITEADKYATEYMQAMAQIKAESSAKTNLWDRFLNILAGVVPFEQNPAERVMMQRWIDGERGEL
jgi:predicted GTPase